MQYYLRKFKVSDPAVSVDSGDKFVARKDLTKAEQLYSFAADAGDAVPQKKVAMQIKKK